MTTKIELGSPEWLAALKGKIETCMAADPGLRFSICEVFTGVPRHLDKHGTGVLAWYCRIADGKLEFEDGEIDDADIKTTTDYAFILPFARMKLTPETMDEYQRMQEDGLKRGLIKPQGDRSKVPPVFHGMHNELAEVTA